MHRHPTYLALGDSYTIGEAVPLHQNFPYQTVQLLRNSGHDVVAPEIIAGTGWTTEALLAAMNGYSFAAKYDLVTLLIGVNNQYQNLPIIFYKQQLEVLLNRGLQLAGGKKDHLFVLPIPDYSTTPFAAEKDREKISKEIDEYNNLKKAICIQYKVPFVDLASDLDEPLPLADDGLHPSASAYATWAKKLSAEMAKLLKK